MAMIKLNNGIKIEVDAVTCSEKLGAFHIYTNKLSMKEACNLFDDPNATEDIAIIEDGKTSGIYSGFTQLYSIRRADFFKSDNMIQISLQIPGNKPAAIDKALGSMLGMFSAKANA